MSTTITICSILHRCDKVMKSLLPSPQTLSSGVSTSSDKTFDPFTNTMHVVEAREIEYRIFGLLQRLADFLGSDCFSLWSLLVRGMIGKLVDYCKNDNVTIYTLKSYTLLKLKLYIFATMYKYQVNTFNSKEMTPNNNDTVMHTRSTPVYNK